MEPIEFRGDVADERDRTLGQVSLISGFTKRVDAPVPERDRLPPPRWALVAVGRGDDGGHGELPSRLNVPAVTAEDDVSDRFCGDRMGKQ